MKTKKKLKRFKPRLKVKPPKVIAHKRIYTRKKKYKQENEDGSMSN